MLAGELTLGYLGHLPRCDEEKLIIQYRRYLGNLRKVQEKLKEHSHVFNTDNKSIKDGVNDNIIDFLPKNALLVRKQRGIDAALVSGEGGYC